MTLTVTDIERSRDFYQGLFRMTIAARQARTLILRVGEGPQFIALGGGRPDVTPHINHFCLTVDAFDDERLVAVWPDDGGLYAVTTTGQVFASRDNGNNWADNASAS